MNVVYHKLAPGLLAFSIVGSALAQEGEQTVPCNELPAAVMAAFSKTYPKAKIKECSKEVEKGKTSYEVASSENDVGRDVLYEPGGNVIVVEETVDLAHVPKPVQRAFKKKSPKATILLTEKLMRGSSVNYEFQFKERGAIKEIAFDSSGKEVEP